MESRLLLTSAADPEIERTGPSIRDLFDKLGDLDDLGDDRPDLPEVPDLPQLPPAPPIPPGKPHPGLFHQDVTYIPGLFGEWGVIPTQPNPYDPDGPGIPVPETPKLPPVPPEDMPTLPPVTDMPTLPPVTDGDSGTSGETPSDDFPMLPLPE